MIKHKLLKIAEKMINKAISFDEIATQRLKIFHDKCFQFELSDMEQSFFVTIENNYVSMELANKREVTLLISSTSTDLLAVLLSKKMSSGRLLIQGDIELAQQLQSFISSLDIDWEGELAKLIGDIPAHFLGNLFRRTGRAITHVFSSLQENTIEYLQEEVRLLVVKEECEDFLSSVDNLTADYERLRVRVEYLQNKMRADQ